MAQIPSTLEGDFIGEVKSYNKVTREIEVFIPKLMPSIPEGQKEIPIRTNMGNNSILTKYNAQIKTASTVTAKAYDTDAPLPKIGSKVLINFLEGSPQYCYWIKFNMNFDYDVIEEEKYPRKFYLKIGDKEIPVNLDDKIIVDIGDEYNVVLLNETPKEKIFKIIKNDTISEEISKLKKAVGETGGIVTAMNEFGEIVPEEKSGSGLLAKMEFVLSKIEELENKLSELK